MFQSKVCFMYLKLLWNHQSKALCNILWCVDPFIIRCQAPNQLPSWWLSMPYIQYTHSYSPHQEAMSFVYNMSMCPTIMTVMVGHILNPSLNTCRVISQSTKPSNIYVNKLLRENNTTQNYSKRTLNFTHAWISVLTYTFNSLCELCTILSNTKCDGGKKKP